MGGPRLARAGVVRPRGDAGRHHAVHDAVRDARRAREADAQQSDDAEPGRVVERVARRPRLRLRPAQGREVPQRRPGHRRGREVLARALPGRRCLDVEGARGRRRGRGSAARAHPAQAAVAGLHDVLCHAGDGRGVDRPQALRRACRRRRLQEGAGGRRALSLRVVQPGRRAGAGGERELLAQDAQREAAGLPLRARRHESPGHAQARRGGHRLLDSRSARRGIAADARPHAQGHLADVHRVDQLHRAMGSEIAVARPARAAGRQPRHRPQGHQRRRVSGLRPDQREHHSPRLRVLLAAAPLSPRSGPGQEAAGRGGLSARLRRR